MAVSMSTSAHYVLPKCWGGFFTGPLTDKKIRKYVKSGYYSNGIAVRASAARQRRTQKRLLTEAIFGKYKDK